MEDERIEIPALQGATYNGKSAPGWTSYTVFQCDRCKRIRQSTSPHTTGYGRITVNDVEEKHCFECCADHDREEMRANDRHTLYLSKSKDSHTGYTVSNWPGTLKLAAYVRKGSHNIAGTRYDVWFTFEGREWHGVQYGENTQICHCRKLKESRKAA